MELQNKVACWDIAQKYRAAKKDPAVTEVFYRYFAVADYSILRFADTDGHQHVYRAIGRAPGANKQPLHERYRRQQRNDSSGDSGVFFVCLSAIVVVLSALIAIAMALLVKQYL